MAKSILKFTFAALLAVLLVIIPLLGIPQLGFSGYLTDDDINISNELAEGQLVRFVLSADSKLGDAVLKNNAVKTAEILRKRLSSLGYSESDVSVVSERDVVLTLPFNADISLVKEKLSVTGNFLFKDSKENTIISSKDIEYCSAYYQTSYDSSGAGTVNYYLAFHLSDEAMKRYTEKTTEIAKSSDKYVKLYVDSTSLSQLNVSEAVTQNDFSFGPFSYEDALWYSTMINAGPTPQSIAPVTYSVEPILGTSAYSTMFLGTLIAVAVAAVLLIVVYKLSGLSLAISLVSALGVTLICSTLFGMTVNLTGITTVIFSALLCLLVNTVLVNAAKKESSANPYTCLKLAMKKKLWFLVDALALPFAISLAMMWYGNIFTRSFSELTFISVMAAVVSLPVTMLTVSAAADAGKKKSDTFGN